MTEADPRDSGAYPSAYDLPTVVEMREHIQAMKLLTRFVARKRRKAVLELESELEQIVGRVDRFYDLLGSRNWIYHDSIHADRAAALLTLAPDAAEEALIGMYRDPGWLEFMIGQTRRFDALRERRGLLEKAEHDFHADRFYATTLVLLAVMDGFVNDVEPANRRGLHARDPDELAAWDSVVGHHMGLAHAHKAFTKSTFKTSTEPIFELHRNGIVHGTLVNFDNVIVATKAWNRLFAVCDWATTLERKAVPPKRAVTWREIATQLADNARAKKSIAAFEPSSADASDPMFFEHEPCARARSYLSAWHSKNYGDMAQFISPRAYDGTPRQMAGTVRAVCSLSELQDFTFVRAEFKTVALCEIDVLLTFDNGALPAQLRWIREREDGKVAIPELDAEWFLYVWYPQAILERE